MRIIHLIGGALSILLLVPGCMVGPKYVYEPPPLDSTYAEPVNADTGALIKWAQLYDDPALVKLIQATLDSNRTMWLAAARVEEARLLAGAVKTNLYPSVNYSLVGGGGGAGIDAQRNGSGVDGGFLEALGQVNWEIDIWGKLRHANRAALAIYLEQEENYKALQVSLVAEVASTYFLLRDLDNRLLIAQRTLVSRQENTRIIGQRFDEGYTNEVDKLQSIQQEQQAAAAIPNIERQIRQVENALRVLQGRSSGTIERGRPNTEQQLTPDIIPMGLPSTLLQRRPDIQAAEANVQALTERAGVAVANRFPTLSLTGVLGFASPEMASLFTADGGMANGFGQLAGPLFNFGRNKKIAEAAKQRIVIAAAQRDQVVFQAFTDVDNSLEYYRTYTAENAARVTQMEAARKALTLSQARYDYGYTSYLEVILMENALFEAELEESATRAQRLNSTVSLFRALGGGW
ncbi:MAG TPA: TolC family protein [Flavobacteriales bacterium]|nr:TolC family protein [Flavobacteriales bacterium]